MTARTTGFIYDTLTGHNFARLDSDGNVYCCNTGEKFATAARDGKLHDLNGEFTGLYLGDLHEPTSNNEAFSRFKSLAAKQH